jgi:hypothetical protein
MARQLSLESTVVVSQNQVACGLGDEVVILNLGDGEYYGLNRVGSRIWAMIQEPVGVAEVRDRLLQEYDELDPERCTREILHLLEQMAESALIEVRAPARR